jgi:large subunit ribosomal protein L29
MDTTTLKNKSVDELKVELMALLREQFNLRMQKAAPGAQIKPNLFKQVRRNIARIKTRLRQKVNQQ